MAINRYLCIFLASMLGASCLAQEIDFSVSSSRDQMGVGSVFSKDATYFSTKGNAQIGIYSRNPYRRTGSICCHKGEITEEYFLKGNEGEDRLLQFKKIRMQGVEAIEASIYSVKGVLLVGPREMPIFSGNLFSVAPAKTYFAILNDNVVSVFDSSLNKVKDINVSIELKGIESIALSNDGDSILIKDSASFVFVAAHAGIGARVTSCDAAMGDKFKIAPHEMVLSKFLVLFESGRGCIISGGAGKEFKMASSEGVIGAYAVDSMLYVLTEVSITAFDDKEFTTVGSFELSPYYEQQFGIPSAHEYPVFLDHEFDSKSNTFYLRGHRSTNVFYEIKVTNK